jgi:hypothetical protein
MLGHRHELDMREAHLDDVVGQVMREFAIAVEAAFLAPPRAEVQFVDGHRRIQRILRRTPGHPFAVAPRVVERPDAGGRGRRQLGAEGEGVGLVDLVVAMARADAVLVGLPRRRVAGEALPDAQLAARFEQVDLARPAVPVADHADGVGVRRPDREVRASVRAQMAAEALVEARVGAFCEQIAILGTEELMLVLNVHG